MGAIALLTLLSAFILVHTNFVLFTGHFHYYDGRRILQILLLTATTLVLVVSSSLRKRVAEVVNELGWVPTGVLIAALGAGIASSLRAPVPTAGLREVALFALLSVFAVAVSATRDALKQRFDLTVIVSLVAAAFIYVGLFILLRRAHIQLLGFESLSVHPQHLFYGWSNARIFGQIGLLVFPFLVAAPLLLRDRSRITRAGAWLVSMGWWALVIEAGGRGSILFTVAAVAAAAALLGRLARYWVGAAAVAIAGGTALWFAASRLMHMLYAPTRTGEAASRGLTPGVERAIRRGASDNVRFEFWQDALEMIRSAPFLGVGPEHYAHYGQIIHTASPHNVPLQIAAEWGIPVALTLGTLVAWAGISWTRKWRGRMGVVGQDMSSLVPALTAAAAGAGMLSMVEGVVVTPASQVMLALVAGWMLAVYRADPHSRNAVSRARKGITKGVRCYGHVTVSMLPVALVAALVWTAGPYLWSPNETLDQQIEEHNFGSLSPRFWVQGRLFDE